MCRQHVNNYFLDMAKLVGTRATCIRRQVGCILVNDKKHVIATGYNGVASGLPHCTDEPCGGEKHESGKGLDACEAIHAEQNALLQCKNVYEIEACYVTVSPCVTCVKLLLNTSCKRILFSEEYPDAKSMELWTRSGREWVHVTAN